MLHRYERVRRFVAAIQMHAQLNKYCIIICLYMKDDNARQLSVKL